MIKILQFATPIPSATTPPTAATIEFRVRTQEVTENKRSPQAPNPGITQEPPKIPEKTPQITQKIGPEPSAPPRQTPLKIMRPLAPGHTKSLAHPAPHFRR